MKALFDVVHESCKTGARKPSPAAYSGVLEALKLSGSPQAAVFLDDIGTNLKVLSAPNSCMCVVCVLNLGATGTDLRPVCHVGRLGVSRWQTFLRLM
jgi:hypothetical protein